MSGATRELALFNLAIDSKLRACDLVRLRVEDLWSGSSIRDRATIVQKKTKRPVQFEVTEQTKIALAAWLPSVKRTVPEKTSPVGSFVDTTVRAHRTSVGPQHWP
jgi:integrase